MLTHAFASCGGEPFRACRLGASALNQPAPGPPSAGGAIAAAWLLAKVGLVNPGLQRQPRRRDSRSRRRLCSSTLPCNDGDGAWRTHSAPTIPTAHPQHARCRLHLRCYLGRRLLSRPHSSWSMRRPANTGPFFTMPVSSVRINGGEQLLAGWGWSYRQGRASGWQRS